MMKIAWLMLATVLAGAGCDQITVTPLGDGGPLTTCPPTPDLQPPTPPCAAAKGLSGDNLLCTDLTAIASLDALRELPGWVVGTYTAGKECWSVGGGQPLQVTGLATVKQPCLLTLPSFDLTNGNYSSITLSIRHTVDLDLGLTAPNQLAEVYLDQVDDSRLVTQTGGRQQLEQQWIVTIEKPALEKKWDPVNSSHTFILRLKSLAGSSYSGWQISSIAINGNK